MAASHWTKSPEDPLGIELVLIRRGMGTGSKGDKRVVDVIRQRENEREDIDESTMASSALRFQEWTLQQ